MNDNQLWLPYTQMKTATPPIEVSSTKNCEIFLKNGRILVDGISSWWTACHGYNHPTLINALATQAQQMPHIMLGGLVHQGALDLSKALSERLPSKLNHCFFTESGSVSVEVALKMALQYWLNQGIKTKRQFLHFEHAYHGDTFYAMSVCDPDEGMHHMFDGMLPKQVMGTIPNCSEGLNQFDTLIAKHHKTLAGMIIEPLLQGAGGMKVHNPEILNEMVLIAQRYGIPVIFDEIFTGFGRTGTMFALDQIDANPDIICLGKALTGGVTPLAATIASTEIYNAFWSNDANKAFMHGPTFMGHALATQVALASLELFDTEPRLQAAQSIESFLGEVLPPLKGYPKVKDIRVKGAMGVIEIEDYFTAKQLNTLKQFYISQGVWIRPFANIIYIAPALTIELCQLEKLCNAMADSLKLI